MSAYIHQHPNWPVFRWNQEKLAGLLTAIGRRQGRFIGRMEALGFSLRAEAELETRTEDVLKTSEIEGEILDKEQVRSSIAKRLGMDIGGVPLPDRHVEGIVEMMLDATQRYHQALTQERLFGWHAALFPTGYSGMNRIAVGTWRPASAGRMQVVSGAIGREKVHFEAPESARLDAEMEAFLDWFENENGMDPVLKAGVAHFWFVTIHPFEDGNGRIARAIADMSLARSENSPQRFYSMSAQIRLERKAYYDLLEHTQKSDLDITEWLTWFLSCLDRAFDGAETTLGHILRKARFWETHRNTSLNERQRKVINRLFDGFHGKLTTSKWAAITKTSTDTALRDISGLVERGILAKDGAGGRSTGYVLRDA